MVRLQTFGGLALVDAAGSPLPLPRRQLALLAMLAAADDPGLSRDKLVARFWSESPPKRRVMRSNNSSTRCVASSHRKAPSMESIRCASTAASLKATYMSSSAR